jgi:leader peptidase (prepilin peptidase)/N-methyltransferase
MQKVLPSVMIKAMETAIYSGVLALLGLMFGSFAGASVWRLRARQLREDKDAGESVDREEYDRLRPLTNETLSTDRSRCLHCGHTLVWYDLLPLVSWLSLRGQCRYCKAPIGKFELITELGVAVAFVVSYLFWPELLITPVAILHFGLWLTGIVLLAILFSYDLKWFLLPDRVVFPLIAVGVLVSVLRLLSAADIGGAIISAAGSVVVLSGLYYFLWLISKGQWIGFGDVKLGLALALLLSDWRLALIALFGANLIGSLLVIPGMLAGRISRNAHVPFGPLLIAGTILAMLFGNQIIAWYQTAAF